MVMSVIMAIGVPPTGAAGVYLAIQVVTNYTTSGIVVWVAGSCSLLPCLRFPFQSHFASITSAILWIINSIFCVYLIKRVLGEYRAGGGVSRAAFTCLLSSLSASWCWPIGHDQGRR